MAGLNGIEGNSTLQFSEAIFPLAGLAIIVWLLPNTQEFLGRFEPALKSKAAAPGAPPLALSWSEKWILWRPTVGWALVIAAITIYALSQISRVNEFIYWQF